MTPRPRTRALLPLALLPLLSGHVDPVRWGRDGHLMSGLAAATDLPAGMPAFFRDAREQLGYLNFEPDRWRGSDVSVLSEAAQYDHFINLENVMPAARERMSRYRKRSGAPSAAGITFSRLMK